MSEYLLAVHGSDDQANYATDEEMQAAFAAVSAFNDELQAAGAWVFAGGLMPKDTAYVVRTNADGAYRTDGPFLESKEHPAASGLSTSPTTLRRSSGPRRARSPAPSPSRCAPSRASEPSP